MIEIKNLVGRVVRTVDADTLRGADLRGAELTGAYLRGAELTGADLTGAQLRDAQLTGADLSGADLSRAYLRGADLRGADLRGAQLTGADLSDANLRGANLIDGGQDRRSYWFVANQHGDGIRIAAGCRWFTLEEAREHWSAEDYYGSIEQRDECLARVEMIARIAESRGWKLAADDAAQDAIAAAKEKP